MDSTAERPTVSVITATYNWSSVLRYAIQSVLWQEFQDFELLVIGDGCTDDSAEVVAAIGDPRIRWHNRAENSGSQSAPNNAGLEMARGRYVAYLGHDDLWLPTHLGRLVQAIQVADADVAYTLLALIGPPETDFRAVTGLSESGGYERDLLVPPSSVMHTQTLAREIGGWKEYRTIVTPPDREFIDRAFAVGKRFVAVPELTAIKFPSAWRRNSYRERRSDEQARYARRIQEEPQFVADELIAILASYVLERRLPILAVQVPDDPPPGWFVQQSRRIRGLEPDGVSEEPADPAPPAAPSALDLRPERYVRSLERALGETERQRGEAEQYARALVQLG